MDCNGLCYTRNAYDFAKESVTAGPGYPLKRNKLWMRVGVIKIVLGFYAILATLGETFGIRWPSVFNSVLAVVKAAFASLSQLTALSCKLNIHQYTDTCI